MPHDPTGTRIEGLAPRSQVPPRPLPRRSVAGVTNPTAADPADPTDPADELLIGPTVGWEQHPGVRTGERLTIGERAADRMRNGMGSWPFVFVFLAIMATWATINSKVLGRDAWDPYPYILLNLFLSMLAGLQGAVLLIAAKRADQISAETALHTLTNTEMLKTLIEQNTELTRQIHELTKRMDEHLSQP